MKVPITQVYFQQPTRKDFRAKVVEKKDAIEDKEPMCQRIIRAVIVGALIFLATHILIWVLR